MSRFKFSLALLSFNFNLKCEVSSLVLTVSTWSGAAAPLEALLLLSESSCLGLKAINDNDREEEGRWEAVRRQDGQMGGRLADTLKANRPTEAAAWSASLNRVWYDRTASSWVWGAGDEELQMGCIVDWMQLHIWTAGAEANCGSSYLQLDTVWFGLNQNSPWYWPFKLQ